MSRKMALLVAFSVSVMILVPIETLQMNLVTANIFPEVPETIVLQSPQNNTIYASQQVHFRLIGFNGYGETLLYNIKYVLDGITHFVGNSTSWDSILNLSEGKHTVHVTTLCSDSGNIFFTVDLNFKPTPTSSPSATPTQSPTTAPTLEPTIEPSSKPLANPSYTLLYHFIFGFVVIVVIIGLLFYYLIHSRQKLTS